MKSCVFWLLSASLLSFVTLALSDPDPSDRVEAEAATRELTEIEHRLCEGALTQRNENFVTITKTDLNAMSAIIKHLSAENAKSRAELRFHGHKQEADRAAEGHHELLKKVEDLERRYPELSVMEGVLQHLEVFGEYVEDQVEVTTHSKFLGFLVMLMIILIPIILTYYIFTTIYRRIQKVISVAQYILICNSFSLICNFVIVIFDLVSGKDPLQIFFTHHMIMFRLFMIFLAVQYVLVLILVILLVANTKFNTQIFYLRTLELCIFVFVGTDFGDLFWFPLFRGQFPFPITKLKYLVYLISYTVCTVLDLFVGVLHLENADEALPTETSISTNPKNK